MTAVGNRLSTQDINVDNTTGLTASRRAGNLWTAEARDDMFNRRERGEPWESICQDYPTRSRHAMQQQYSMMKKTRMMAEGTWTTNRRGRKRKVLPTAGAPSIIHRRESGLETTEDEFQSVTPSDLDPDDPDDMPVDEIDIGTPAPETNGLSGPSQSVLDFRPGRPSGLSRSTTDPASALRGRGRGRARAASAYIHSAHAAAHADSGHPPLAPKGFTPINEERDGRQSKRNVHENAMPPAAKRQKSQAESPPSAEASQSEIKYPFSETTVYFTKEDVHAFFKRGIENGERARKLLEDDQAMRDKAFHDAQGRANRRAYEAEERLKDAGYRHRSDIRHVENRNLERMDNLRYEYEQKIEELKKQLAVARGVDVASIELPQPQQQQQQQPQQLAQKASAAAASATAVENVTVPSGSEVMDPDVESKQVMLLVANLEELKGRWEGERELRKKAEAKATSIAQDRTAITLQTLAPDFLVEFQQLDLLVTRLHSEVGDLTPNALAKSLAEIHARCAQIASHFKPQAPAPSPSYGSLHSTGGGGSPTQVQAHALPPLHPPPPSPSAAVHVHQPMPTPPPQSQHMRTDSGSNSAYRPQTGNGPPTHLAPMKLSGSPSPSPASAMRPYDSHMPSGSPRQGLPTPSEPPFEGASSYEHKRSTPVTINQLLSQEPAVAPAPNLPQPNLVNSPSYEPSRHAHVPAPLSAPPPLSTPLTSPRSEPPRSAHSEQQSHSIKHEHQHQHHQSQQQQQQQQQQPGVAQMSGQQNHMGQPSPHWA